MNEPMAPRIAVLIPCFNEGATIATVVRDFAAALPSAKVFVYDNNSTDDTAEVARAAGAVVRREPMQGKGYVVRRMFADIDADVYVMVDGDATYEAADAPALVGQLWGEQRDVVVARRVNDDSAAYRRGHVIGNRLLTGLAGWIFGNTFADMLSGYRVLSRRFVKSFPMQARGFEIETELAVHALELRMPVVEVPSRYKARPEGSQSKLRTWSDGWQILMTILKLTKNGRPLAFFSVACVACVALSVGLALPLFKTYLLTGLVPRFPTAILSAALALLGSVFLVCGLVLDTVTMGRREAKYLAYLAVPSADASVWRNPACAR
ncbi:glycosyltransferase [Dyella sp. KULCS107]|jgi:glycosyltransferase involved in cell wall biosynthesis|uniref:glycosyltransferase n=1 Tax=Dyella sp. KULCS107 TaxID=3422216 RepID=UPI00086D52ED|nr:MAG: glycosyl transferase [Rhodanobacter sp. SCN 68-63]